MSERNMQVIIRLFFGDVCISLVHSTHLNPTYEMYAPDYDQNIMQMDLNDIPTNSIHHLLVFDLRAHKQINPTTIVADYVFAGVRRRG